MVICSDLALPVAHYNQHRKLQDAAFSTEGPPVKEGACLHAVETVNSRLADTCSIVGSLVIFGYMWCAFLTFSYTLSLCVLVLFICVSVFESFPTGLVGQTSQVSRNSIRQTQVVVDKISFFNIVTRLCLHPSCEMSPPPYFVIKKVEVTGFRICCFRLWGYIIIVPPNVRHNLKQLMDISHFSSCFQPCPSLC